MCYQLLSYLLQSKIRDLQEFVTNFYKALNVMISTGSRDVNNFKYSL